MIKPPLATCLLALLVGCSLPLGTAEGAAPYAGRIGPMETGGLDKRLKRLLRNHYESSYGGFKNWQQIESVRFEGRLIMPDGSVRFLAYKKKPNYFKIVLNFPGGHQRIMAYDGKEAWQLDTRRPNAQPAAMPADEALNFIRDASTGSHLLYPLRTGKTISMRGLVEVRGEKCLELEVTLPSGQTVVYALDLANNMERQNITTNAVSGKREVTTHHAFRSIEGVRFPVESSLRIDGKVVHRMKIDNIAINTGATSWMFQRPSAESIPEENAGAATPSTAEAPLNPDKIGDASPERRVSEVPLNESQGNGAPTSAPVNNL